MDDGMVDRVGCVGQSDEIVEEKNKQSERKKN